MPRKTFTVLVLAALTVLALAAAGAEIADLGSLDFPNSGAPEAQGAFVRGVLLLHSFEYDDAREAFDEAQAIDPDFALAYWGEAMTHNHPLWRRQDRDAALAALAEYAASAAERAARAPSERERAYLGAVEALYGGSEGSGDKLARDEAYSRAMGAVAERWPHDLEARAFYALSILGTTQGERDFRTYMRAAAAAEEVYAANPRHPGALHYLIHSYDDPVHAPLGLRAARVYADVAPAASHAQHMISHIHLALGRWRESVDANRKSFAVSAERRARKGLGPDALNHHSLQWLAYAYLELGRFKEARATLDEMSAYARESDSYSSRWYHAAMRATWVAETGDPDPPPGPEGELRLSGAAPDRFADGYAAWKRGDHGTARSLADALDGLLADAEETGGRPQTRTEATVMAKSLRALVELAAGDREAATALLDEATALESSLALDYGPPNVVKPSHELYGEVLLRAGDHRAARSQFEKALERAPRRTLSLAGLAQAARGMGDEATEELACRELREIYAGADEGLAVPGGCGARP